jgi:hypothetical protein
MTKHPEQRRRTATAAYSKEEPAPRPTTAGAAPGFPPRLDGDLAAMVGWDPDFRIRWRGYDQLQVDNYVAWVDTELTSSRVAHEQAVRMSTEIAARLGVCELELEQERQELAEARAAAATQVSGRVREILHLAAQEAEELRACGRDEAKLIRLAAQEKAGEVADNARREADVVLKEAGAQRDRIATGAQRLDAEAKRARKHADDDAAARRAEADRLSREKRERAEALAVARLEELHAQIAELLACKDKTLAELGHVHEWLSAALDTADRCTNEQRPNTSQPASTADDATGQPRPAA